MNKHFLLGIALFLGSIQVYSQARNLDSAELKYLAGQLKESTVAIGVFDIPDIETPLRAMKSGYVPETDDDYIAVAINNNILKLHTMKTLKGNFDSLVFIKLPVPDVEGMDNFLFFSYPSSKWVLFLQPCLQTSSSGTVVKGWVKSLPKTYADYKFISENSTFDLHSSSHTCYNLAWPEKTDKKPAQVISVSQPFVDDLTKISAWSMQSESPEKSAGLAGLTSTLVTKEGKTICYYLGK